MRKERRDPGPHGPLSFGEQPGQGDEMTLTL